MMDESSGGALVEIPSTAASGSAVPGNTPMRLSVEFWERKMVEFIVEGDGGSTATPSREKIDPDAEVATKLKSELMEEAFIRLMMAPVARELLLNTRPNTVVPLPTAVFIRRLPSRHISVTAFVEKEEERYADTPAAESALPLTTATPTLSTSACDLDPAIRMLSNRALQQPSLATAMPDEVPPLPPSVAFSDAF